MNRCGIGNSVCDHREVGTVVVLLKVISARLKQVFKGAYKEDEGTFVKIGQFLRRPDYPFESRC